MCHHKIQHVTIRSEWTGLGTNEKSLPTNHTDITQAKNLSLQSTRLKFTFLEKTKKATSAGDKIRISVSWNSHQVQSLINLPTNLYTWFITKSLWLILFTKVFVIFFISILYPLYSNIILCPTGVADHPVYIPYPGARDCCWVIVGRWTGRF